jgi:RNA polymerase sigma factor (sigma-70 family)
MAAQRQNPAYRPAKENPRKRGGFLYVQSLETRHVDTAVGAESSVIGEDRESASRTAAAGHSGFVDGRDPEAFRAFYRAHYRTVCRYLSVRTDRDVVEDVAAETFLVAWRRQADLPQHAVPWLLNTAGKCLANHRRSRERSNALVNRLGGSLPGEDAGIDDALARSGQLRALRAALTGLSDLDRELLLLSHWDGLAPREIASVLDVNAVVLRARLHRASRRLRESLAAALGDEEAGAGGPLRETPDLTKLQKEADHAPTS